MWILRLLPVLEGAANLVLEHEKVNCNNQLGNASFYKAIQYMATPPPPFISIASSSSVWPTNGSLDILFSVSRVTTWRPLLVYSLLTTAE